MTTKSEGQRPRWRIIGKFCYGCQWESNETFASRQDAARTLEHWNDVCPTPNDWTRIVEVESQNTQALPRGTAHK